MNDPFEPGLLHRLPEPPRKVAVLRASRIGDLLCALPSLKALRYALPHAEISLITLPILRDLAERIPFLDRTIEFPGYPGIAEQLFDPRRAGRFFQRMQRERFDLAVQMQGTGVNSNPFVLMMGARLTAGMVRPGDTAGRLDAAFPTVEQGSEIRRMLDYVEFLGAPAQDEPAELGLTGGDWRHAHSHLDRLAHPLIGLHPAARSNTRRWALEHFAAAGAQVQRQFGGTLVGLGEAAEEETVNTVLESAGVPSVNLAGCTSLPVLAAVIASLDVLVTNDTGPAHVAYSFGTPTVVIFGSADPERYLPPGNGPYRPLIYPVPCRPCGLEICPIGYTCLNGIRVEDVVRSAEELLTRRPQSPRASGLPDP